jgi:pyrimidine-nucleoside phosphorylase
MQTKTQGTIDVKPRHQTTMDPVSMILTKRSNDRPHTEEELEWWIQQYTNGDIPDYQMSAWLMAVCWRGMDTRETAALTRCMVESGDQLEWGKGDNAALLLADKHSTGGVGDKVSLILAPLAACLGAHVPMIAGRGLGHTGGTIDKLESIPGYLTCLTMTEFQEVVQAVGAAIVSPSETLCPADRKLYALRDVTATVSCIPLQAASIMSKKIAEHPHNLVLDVKYGRAAFQESAQQAEVLACSMIAAGQANGVQTCAFLTRMDHPIGSAVGNWLEVYECIHIMKTGKGRSNLVTLAVVQTAQLVQPLYPDLSWEDLVHKTCETLQSGQVYSKFREMVVAQGGDASYLDQCPPNEATYMHDILAPGVGFLADINALIAGQVCVRLGAGRTNADDLVDPVAGIWFHAEVGDLVVSGSKIATIYTNISSTVLKQAAEMLEKAFQYSDNAMDTPPIISHRVTGDGKMEVFTLPTTLKT